MQLQEKKKKLFQQYWIKLFMTSASNYAFAHPS